jgi:Fic family protein
MANDPGREIPLGLHALIEDLGLEVPRPIVRSLLVKGNRRTWISDAGVIEHYPKAYAPEGGMVGQLRFALRYEPLDLGVYKAIFGRIDKTELECWIQGEPNGIFARRAWYLYELFTGARLDVADLKSGPYIDLLNPELHIVGPAVRVRRQRVFANLLGNKDYCPLIRRTGKLAAAFAKDFPERARTLVAAIEPALLKRAVHYLFTKETRSSFAIEGEAPSQDRTSRFVATLMRAEQFDPTTKNAFIELQNAIVDPRYAQRDWRDLQVYVGETLPDYSQQVHFVCPKPEDIPSLMDGWMHMLSGLLGPESRVDPVCVAAAGAFGFVFLHPFLDGNGRIHRFIVHHVLAKLKYSPPGVVFPVSAAMLRDMAAYDRTLEAFSAAVAPFIRTTMDADQAMRVENETADLYRYFDATAQTEYLFDCIEETISRDLKQELDFLAFFDLALHSLLDIVDMPNQRATLLIRLIHQNDGRLSNNKRSTFHELTEAEIDRIESAIKAVASRALDPASPTAPRVPG